MLSKTIVRARLAGRTRFEGGKRSRDLLLAASLLLVAAACTSALPWKKDPPPDEVNLAFVVRNNLLFLPSAKIDGLTGKYFFGSAASHTVLDPTHAANRRVTPGIVTLGERRSARVNVVTLPLQNIGDGIIGADAIGANSVTIDYRSGLLTIGKDGMQPEAMSLFQFTVEPTVNVTVGGRQIAAVVDTALPDTLVLPARAPRRGTAEVSVAGANFGTIDVAYAPVKRARIGNRLLYRFLVTIDYRRHLVGLWRDPRIP